MGIFSIFTPRWGGGTAFPYQIVNNVKNVSRNRQILLDDEATSAENQAPQAWVLAPGQQVGSALPPAPQLQAQLQHNDQHSVPQLPAVMERMGGTGPQSRAHLHPPPPTQGARQPGWGERRGSREHPGERVGARGRGRGRARKWHTRVTALHGQGGQTCRQGRQREGEWEGRQAREGVQGSGTRVTRRRAEGTRRARGSSKEHEHRKKNNGRTSGHTGRAHRVGRAWEVGGTGGQRGRKGTHCLSQRSTMPMTRIEPYRPPRPTIRELMEGRPAKEDDGGVPPKGCLGRPPRSAYRSEDRGEALRHVRAREIQPRRGDDQRRAHGAGEQH